MKIYCNNNNTLSVEAQLDIFEQCRKQRLWVKCEDELAKLFGGSGILYICPKEINKDYRSPSTGEIIPTVYGNSTRSDTDKLPVLGFDSQMNTYYLSNIHIITPVATFTSEELFGLDTDAHKRPFTRIAGKSVWILASGPDVGWVYLKVLDASNPDKLIAETIPDEYVYPDPDSYLEYNPYGMREEQDIPWSKIQAYMPIDILTDDEMDEALAVAEEIYENPNLGD